MCGIAGALSTTLNNHELIYVRQLMLMSVLRGWEGSGAFVVRPHHKKMRIDMYKTEFCAAELAIDPKFDEMLKSPKVVVAHARAPTMGGTDYDSIHPHRVGNITGVHNGTIHQIGGQTVPKTESDSRLVFDFINKHGAEAFVKECRGAYSLVWTNAHNGTLNFLRNDQRPMVFARVGTSDFASTMYFASEKSFLEYVLSERGNISKTAIAYMSPKPYQHIVFPLNISQGCKPRQIIQYEDPFAHYKNQGDFAKWAATHDCSRFEKNDNKGESVIPLPDRSDRMRDPWRPNHGANGTREETGLTTSGSNNSTTSLGTRSQDVLRGQVGPYTNPQSLPRVEELLGQRRLPAAGKTFPAAKLEELITKYACVICDERPKVERSTPDRGPIVPPVHLVKFGQDGQTLYICDDCVKKKNHLALTVLGAQIAAGSKQ